jgi:acetyl-CoA carboxylase biotin carboxyl carrier protein
VSLTAKDVAEITRLLEESNFDELFLETDGFKLSLRRGAAAAPAESATPPAAVPAGAQPPAESQPPCDARAAGAALANEQLHVVSAPMLGIFHRSPKPGAAPFVEVGSAVEPDTIIGIIEIMKLMNTIRAGVRGTVVEIPGVDGALVEVDQVLLRVKGKAAHG